MSDKYSIGVVREGGFLYWGVALSGYLFKRFPVSRPYDNRTVVGIPNGTHKA